jgi:hypothetical protein
MAEEIIEEVITCGEPFVIEFKFEENDTPFPIGNLSAKIQLRTDRSRGAILKTWLDGALEIVRDDGAGKLTLTIPPSTTDSFSFKVGFIDCLLWDASDVEGIRSDALQVTLKRGVTDHG